MSAGVPMTSPDRPNRGLSVKQVMIRSVEPAADQVLATDTGGRQIELPYSICRTGRWPRVGETWIVDRSLGFWSLSAFMGTPSNTIPTGPAGGDLGGSYPDPSVDRLHGVAVTGTPTAGQVITATGPADADWQTPAGTVSSVNGRFPIAGAVTLAPSDLGALDASLDLADLFSAGSARTNLGLAGAATLNVGTTTGTVAAGNDSRITGAVQKSLVTTKGDLLVATASGTVARLGVGTDGRVLMADSVQPGGVGWGAPPAAAGGDAAPPTLNGLLAWNYDQLMTNTNESMTVNVIFYMRVILPTAMSITNIHIYVVSAGNILTVNQNFAGIYDSSGNRLAVTADQSGTWNSAGVKKMSLVSGPFALAAGTYYVGLLSNGSTAPFISDCNVHLEVANMGQSGPPYRFNKDNAGGTSLPSTWTLGSLVDPNRSFWVGLS